MYVVIAYFTENISGYVIKPNCHENWITCLQGVSGLGSWYKSRTGLPKMRKQNGDLATIRFM